MVSESRPPIDEKQAQDLFAQRAAELGLKPVQLPFPSMCMDGVPCGNYGSNQKTFPTALEDFENRLALVGQRWSHQRVMEFVDERGRYHVARDIPANQKALRDAGYKKHPNQFSCFVNGNQPAEEKHLARFKAVFLTPQDQEERLYRAVIDYDLGQFNVALANGADVAKAGMTYNNRSPLIFYTMNASSLTEDPTLAAITERLIQTGPLMDSSGETALHKAMYVSEQNGQDYGLKIIPKLLKAGVSPLAINGSGLPVFLAGQSNDLGGGNKLKLLTEVVLKIEGLTKREKTFIKAHNQYVKDVLPQNISDVLHGDRSRQAGKVMEGLRAVWKQAHQFAASDDEGAVPSRVLDFFEPLTNTKSAPKFKEFIQNAEPRNFGLVDDLIHEFSQRVVLPLYLLDFHKKHGVHVSDDSLRAIEQMGQRVTDDMIDVLKPHVKDTLLKGRSIDKIVGLSEAWHDPRVVFPDALIPIKASGAWHSLTGEKEHKVPDLPGITLHILTTHEELQREGRLLSHCVGGGAYTTKCLNANAHIISVRKEGQEKPLSTIEAQWDGRKLSVKQNQGQGNSTPVTEAKQAEAWFVEQMNSRAIKPNQQLGETEESKKLHTRPKFLNTIGYELASENVDAAFHEYCTNSLRRGREYNAETGKFDKISKTTELIAGTHTTVLGDGAFILLDAKKNPIQTRLSYKKLPADVWFEASGLREKLSRIEPKQMGLNNSQGWEAFLALVPSSQPEAPVLPAESVAPTVPLAPEEKPVTIMPVKALLGSAKAMTKRGAKWVQANMEAIAARIAKAHDVGTVAPKNNDEVVKIGFARAPFEAVEKASIVSKALPSPEVKALPMPSERRMRALRHQPRTHER